MHEYLIIEGNKVIGCKENDAPEEVIIPEGIFEIGDDAFSYCDNLKRVIIPIGVCIIGKCAFQCCKNLSEVILPKRLTRIGEAAFYGTPSLKSITLPYGVTTIQRQTFMASGLEEIILPDSVYDLREEAFADCENLKRVTVNGLARLGKEAFISCISLQEINISSQLRAIPERAFHGCASLRRVVLNEGLEAIGDYAFSGCTSLLKLKIPDTVTEIGDYPFSHCDSLRSITLGVGIKKLGEGAFAYLPALSELEIKSEVEEMGQNLIVKSGIEKLSILKGTKYIDDFVFMESETLKELYLPVGLEAIGAQSFAGCTSLNKIMLSRETKTEIDTFEGVPAEIEYIENDEKAGDSKYGDAEREYGLIFEDDQVVGWNKITPLYLIIPEGVTKIGEGVFEGAQLKNVKLPSTLKEIGKRAFKQSRIEKIEMNDGVEIIGDEAFYHAVAGGLRVPKMLLWVGKWAFCNTALSSEINLPCIKEIGEEAFWLTSAPKALLGRGLIKIGKGAFSYSTVKELTLECAPEMLPDRFLCGAHITSLTVPEGVCTLGDDCMKICRSLRTLYLPSTLTSVCVGALDMCFENMVIEINQKKKTSILTEGWNSKTGKKGLFGYKTYKTVWKG